MFILCCVEASFGDIIAFSFESVRCLYQEDKPVFERFVAFFASGQS
jgi:hypothetical protein